MTVRWSSIHAQLGLTPGELTYDMIVDAVVAHVIEDGGLDWKQVVPTNDALKDEYVKDIAALANARGGLIVYGVAEDGNAGADEIKHVDNSDHAQRTMRSLAHSRISPAVAGLEMIPLTSPDQKKAVLVVSVPRSLDAPHFIGDPQKALGVPVRNGTQTSWARERDIERAYRDRFIGQTDEQARLLSMFDELAEQLQPKRPWVVAVARPRTPLPSLVAAPTRADATQTLEATLTRAFDVLPRGASRYEVIRQLDASALNPRVGLRRWIARTFSADDPYGPSSFVHVELHHDGSVVLAAASDVMKSADYEDRWQVPTIMIESFCADFVSTVETHARRMGLQAPVGYQVQLSRPDSDVPFVAIDLERAGGFVTNLLRRVPGSRELSRFTPAKGEVPAVSDADTLRAVARQLAEDILHQFGVETLSLLS